MPDELQELHEHAEEGAQHSSLAPVTITMAIFAVLVAAVSLLGHRAHTEELLHQTEATDQWAYYQAKDIRRHTYELFLDELSVFALQNSGETEKIREKYSKEVERYRDEQKEIEAEAKKAQDDVKREGRRADRFDLGEVLLEAALVICSITLLTRKRFFWGMGLVLGVLGVVIGAAGLLIH
jgi:Flp pilus assembly protein TadB